VTQNPLDIPDTVSRQLGNRIQHALRAFTPAEQKAVRSAADTFRKNPKLDTETAIMELGIGEALVSALDMKGQPTIVEKTFVKPPSSRVGPITDAERKAVIEDSPVARDYDEVEDRESAYEILQQRTSERAEAAAGTAQNGESTSKRKPSGDSRSDGVWTTFWKAAIRTVVPAATRMGEKWLKDSIRRGTLGGIRRGGSGGFTGHGLTSEQKDKQSKSDS
jgi:uncharacterized protein